MIDPLTRRFGDYHICELPQLLAPGDVLVVNDAATLPASLQEGDDLELRLIAAEADGSFRAVAFGAGDARLPTEERALPRTMYVGERLRFGPDLAARVVEIDATEPRLLRIVFDRTADAFWPALYARAKPIRYSYLEGPLELWDVQNGYAARPWAFELPSAGRPLTFETLFELERRGVLLASVTHAAGVSSTGSVSLDARLPLPERFEVGAKAARTIASARALDGLVVAVGTSVVRALESAAGVDGGLAASSGYTSLRLTGQYPPRVVDGLLTGLHEPGTSHFELLEAFAPRDLLERASAHAGRTGYLQHEFGDSCLILPGALLEPLEA